MYINFNDFVNENLNNGRFDVAIYDAALKFLKTLFTKYSKTIDKYGIEYIKMKEFALKEFYLKCLEFLNKSNYVKNDNFFKEFKNAYVNAPTIDEIIASTGASVKSIERDLFNVFGENFKNVQTFVDMSYDSFGLVTLVCKEIAEIFKFPNMANAFLVDNSPVVQKDEIEEETAEEYNNRVYPISFFQKSGEGTKQDPIKLKLDGYSADRHYQSFFYFLNSVIAARKNQKYVVMIDKYSENASTIFNNYTNSKYPKFELGRSNTTFLNSISAVKNTPILTDDLDLLNDDTIWQFENTLQSKFKISLQDYVDILAATSRPVFLFERLYGRYNDFSNFQFPKWLKKIENQFKFVIVK
jgi:hypothetical protein